AQIFPVQVTPQILPPYSFRLSDYATSTREKLFVNLLLTDAMESGRRVRLRMNVEGPGISFRTVDFVAGAAPIVLNGGVNLRLSNFDLRPYFELNNLIGISPQQYGQQLPEGQYRFCFEVYDQFSGQRISNNSCANIYLQLNDPPLLNVPFRGDVVTAQQPQNLIFNWTPRHINAAGVQYEFTLKELWDTGMDPQASFFAAPPLYQTTTFANTLHYGPAQTPLLEGRTYGWQVRAFVSDGFTETSLFRNSGMSEVYHFTYRADCHPPRFVLSEAQNARTVRITWQMGEQLRYRVQYRKKGYGDGDWFGLWSRTNEAIIRNLEPGTVYEFRVGGDCSPLLVSPKGGEGSGDGISFSPIHEFTTPTEEEMAYYNCGIPPEIEIGNQEPLLNLGVNEVFTAGDFPVTVVEVKGNNGRFSGQGFITVPYLANTKIAVGFTNITINTDYELIDGIVETHYDPTWGNIGDLDAFVEDIGELFNALFSQKEELLAQLSEAESFDEQQGIISQINDLEVTIGQQIDQIPNKENLPQELQDELESLKQEGDIVANSTLTPQEIESISTADAKRRERISEIAAIVEDELSSEKPKYQLFGVSITDDVMKLSFETDNFNFITGYGEDPTALYKIKYKAFYSAFKGLSRTKQLELLKRLKIPTKLANKMASHPISPAAAISSMTRAEMEGLKALPIFGDLVEIILSDFESDARAIDNMIKWDDVRQDFYTMINSETLEDVIMIYTDFNLYEKTTINTTETEVSDSRFPLWDYKYVYYGSQYGETLYIFGRYDNPLRQ
uniref:fibronectin type III domain-containing protein n=1 Tax=Flagellimonas marinaquae TaxID=254955 RepID=UPI0019D09DBA